MTISILYDTKDPLTFEKETSENVTLECTTDGRVIIRVALESWVRAPIALHREMSRDDLLELSDACRKAAKLRKPES